MAGFKWCEDSLIEQAVLWVTGMQVQSSTRFVSPLVPGMAALGTVKCREILLHKQEWNVSRKHALIKKWDIFIFKDILHNYEIWDMNDNLERICVSWTAERSRDSHLQYQNTQVVMYVLLKISWKKHTLQMSPFRIH